jgi:RecA/RadA recombinase
MTRRKKAAPAPVLHKALTGIQGLDEITDSGLPAGRPTLVSGGAGSGKTMFALEFLVRGATEYNEPGAFISFEETIPDLTRNAASLGFDLNRLIAEKKLFIDHVHISRADMTQTGEYDLDACSSASPTPSSRSAPAASFSTRSKRCSASCRTTPSSAPKSGACSPGSGNAG